MQFDSTLESVDQAENTLLAYAEQAGFDEDSRLQLGMALRESMVNAVVHGNKYSTGKKVRLVLEFTGSRLSIRVIDQGDGFNPNAVPDPLAQENLLRQSGRGLLLMRAFVDEFEVRRAEPTGTEIFMAKLLART